jgi:glycerophosphoryl diester phosphodiesterase
MSLLDWLVARPVAHRGLHDAADGVIENTAAAAAAAIAAGYAIEVDLQVTADGDAIVYHDEVLGRLTDGAGAVAGMEVAELKRVPFRGSADRMITLGDLCDLVCGRVPLLLELKSHGDRDLRLAERVTGVLQGYRGPVAVMSFDPGLVAAVGSRASGPVRGIVAERSRRSLGYLGRLVRTCPAFVAYSVNDLPAPAPSLARRCGLPVLTWTVRTPDQYARARRFADQIIFEGFRP